MDVRISEAPAARDEKQPAASLEASGSLDSEARADAAPVAGSPVVTDAQGAPDATPEPAPEGRPAAAAKKPAKAAPSGLRQLKLPPMAPVAECLRTLLGDEVEIRKGPLTVDYQKALDAFWISTLVDDKDNEIGAVLSSLEATVYLGGVLMMLPESELAAQIKRCEPSEDAIAAMAEVCNNLISTFNDVDGNPHVRSIYLVPHNLEEHEWLGSAVDVLQLDDNFGGKTLLIARKV
jgi:hypothetical protein